MKIVDLETMRTMPEGTLFQKWAPCFFGDMSFYGGDCGADFISCVFGAGAVENDGSDDFFQKCDEMAERGASYPVDLDFYGRDGCFDKDQLFAIWEPDDVRALIAELERGLAQGTSASGQDAKRLEAKPAGPVTK